MKLTTKLFIIVFILLGIKTGAYILSPAIMNIIERDTAQIISTIAISGVGIILVFALILSLLQTRSSVSES